MEAVGEKKGATAAAEGKMMKKQEEKGVVASDSEAEKEKMLAEQFEKAVVVSEAESGKMVEGKGEKAVAPSDAENEKMVEGQQGDKAVAPSEAENEKMVEGQQGDKAVAPSEAEIGTAEAQDVTGGRLITLNLKSSDGEVHRVSEAAAQLSGLLRRMVENNVIADNGVVTLSNVDRTTVVTVLEYCNKHAEAAATARVTSAVDRAAASEALEAWDRDLLDRLTMGALYNLFLASSVLNIEGLLRAIAQKAAAHMMRARQPSRSGSPPTSGTPSTSSTTTSPRRNRRRGMPRS